MICATCKRELFACECPDVDEKILSIMVNPSTELLGRQARREREVYKLGVKAGKQMSVTPVGGKL